MRVLDLFSGLGGWSAAFRDRGHSVTTLDVDPRFGADYIVDLMDVHNLSNLGGPFDVVLASPPCECFSVMTVGRNWNKDRTPKTERAKAALDLARHTFALIEGASPTWYVVENPRGMLRKVAATPPTATTWYCRWGMPYAKPTDLWTNLNGGMPWWPLCTNGGSDHPYTPRGEKRVGVQADGRAFAYNMRPRRSSGHDNMSKVREPISVLRERHGVNLVPAAIATNNDTVRAAFRALIPYRLSLAVALACEDEGRLPAMDALEQIEALGKQVIG